MNKIPPFYENFDNTHCYQCTLRGILEYFEPDQVWAWGEWDTFTNKLPDKWTWPQRGAINMMKRGYQFTSITDADLNRYLEIGVYEALAERLGKEAADKQRQMADLEQVKEDIKEYLHMPQREHIFRVPIIDDIANLLNENYLINSSLNAKILDNQNGYAAHSVLIYDLDNQYVYFHDSNLPGTPERKVPISKFIEASTNPTPSQWSISAYKLEK